MLSQHKKDYFSFETFRTNLTITTKINLEQRHEKEDNPEREVEKTSLEVISSSPLPLGSAVPKKRQNIQTIPILRRHQDGNTQDKTEQSKTSHNQGKLLSDEFTTRRSPGCQEASGM